MDLIDMPEDILYRIICHMALLLLDRADRSDLQTMRNVSQHTI